MGLTAVICLATNGCECIRETNKFYVKIDKKIDGIDVYEYNPEHMKESNWYYQVFCPICSNYLDSSNGTTSEIFRNTIIAKGPVGIYDLKEQYDKLILDRSKVDIFPELETIINNIENIKSNFEKNRYYKDKCARENKEYYIRLYNISLEEAEKRKDFKFTDKRYDIKNWKNDENLKNILLTERKKANEEYLIEEYNKKVLEEYDYQKNQLEHEWNELTFKLEYNIYKKKIAEINEAKRYIHYEETFNSANLWNITRVNGVKYLSTRGHIIDYVANFAVNDFERNCYYALANRELYRFDEEKKEFENFVQKRLPKPKLKTIGEINN
jgi:hypothetical protein